MIIKKENSNYNIPDFLIVGGAKCGTTSLSQYLSKHSNIFIPKVKECRYLSKMTPNFNGPGDHVVNIEMTTSLKEYSDLFKKAKAGQFLCDASVDYLYYYNETISSINDLYKDEQPKVIILLRNPVKSAFSMYSHLKRDLRETLPLNQAIKAQKDRQKNNWEWVWQYTEISKYYNQVKYYKDNIDKENLKIIIFEEFIKDPQKELKEILVFLGLEDQDLKGDKVHNKSGNAKSPFLQKIILNKSPLVMFIKKLIPRGLKQKVSQVNIEPVAISQEDIKLLKPYFEEDIIKLEKLLNKDLSLWRNN